MSHFSTTRVSGPITGRFVFLCVVAFFAVIVSVNMTLVRFALSTFGGVETRNAYQAGLKFSEEIAGARAQDSRRLKIDISITGKTADSVQIEVSARQDNGAAISGAELIVTAVHPADRRLDVVIATNEIGPGIYRGRASVLAGQRDLVVDVFRGGERLFRSKNRVTFQ